LPTPALKWDTVGKEKARTLQRPGPLGRRPPAYGVLGEAVTLSIHNRRLTEVLDRARLAVVGSQAQDIALTSTPAPITARPTEPPAPAVRLSKPTPAPAAPLRPSCAPLGTLADLDQLRPGPRRLLELLHQVAVSTVTARAYPVAPSQVTVHQPQELLARALGCHLGLFGGQA